MDDHTLNVLSRAVALQPRRAPAGGGALFDVDGLVYSVRGLRCGGARRSAACRRLVYSDEPGGGGGDTLRRVIVGGVAKRLTRGATRWPAARIIDELAADLEWGLDVDVGAGRAGE